MPDSTRGRELRTGLALDGPGRYAEIGHIQAGDGAFPDFLRAYDDGDTAALQQFLWPDPAADAFIVYAVETAEELRLALCRDDFELYSGLVVARSRVVAPGDVATRVRACAQERWRPL